MLQGVRIMFSRIIPLEMKDPQRHPLWVMAKRFGASCTTAATPAGWADVTHLITNTQHTLKVCRMSCAEAPSIQVASLG